MKKNKKRPAILIRMSPELQMRLAKAAKTEGVARETYCRQLLKKHCMVWKVKKAKAIDK